MKEDRLDGPLLGPDNGGCPETDKQTMYIYIYIGESDSLANYYYIYANNLNQQALMHRYNISIIYKYAHMHFTLVSQIVVYMIMIKI